MVGGSSDSQNLVRMWSVEVTTVGMITWVASWIVSRLLGVNGPLIVHPNTVLQAMGVPSGPTGLNTVDPP